MRIAVVSKYNQVVIKYIDAVPRIGDRVCLFHYPHPRVTDVVWWPSKDRLRMLNVADDNIDVIVVVK